MAQNLLPRPITEVLTDATKGGLEVGDRHIDENGYEYVLCSGVASNAAGQVVTITPGTYAAVRLTKAQVDKLHPVGVSMSAATSSSTYCWVGIKGDFDASALTLCAPDVALYTSGTAGSVDDDATSQTKINRMVARETAGGSTENIRMLLTYPSAQ